MDDGADVRRVTVNVPSSAFVTGACCAADAKRAAAHPQNSLRGSRRVARRAGATVFCMCEGRPMVLLGREYHGYAWTDFGGSVKAGEDPVAAAAREFDEETMGIVTRHMLGVSESDASERATPAEDAIRLGTFCRRMTVDTPSRVYDMYFFQVPWFDAENIFYRRRKELRRIHANMSAIQAREAYVRSRRHQTDNGRTIPLVGDVLFDGSTVAEISNVSYGGGTVTHNMELSFHVVSINASGTIVRRVETFSYDDVVAMVGGDRTNVIPMVQALLRIVALWTMVKYALHTLPASIVESNALSLTYAGDGSDSVLTSVSVNIDYLEKSTVRWWSLSELVSAAASTVGYFGASPRMWKRRGDNGVDIIHEAFLPFVSLMVSGVVFPPTLPKSVRGGELRRRRRNGPSSKKNPRRRRLSSNWRVVRRDASPQ